MDAVFALAMIRAITQEHWNFTAFSLWEMSPIEANSPVTVSLPSHDTLFLNAFIGRGSAASTSLWLTPITILLYQGYDQRLPLAYLVAANMTASNVHRVQVENNSISISRSFTTGTELPKLVGSIIAIT